ncbi:hypothetical protein EVAR_35777_1 [Eumeta japonica]|uniref:Uncharacterized protein n=1 Tax=Eumeta variegata TaxID=151549 RepID=A0A4C1WMF9_EUMVA|nr:hypothetical protein EVAR_35777_1 [Eumeta japonica]
MSVFVCVCECARARARVCLSQAVPRAGGGAGDADVTRAPLSKISPLSAVIARSAEICCFYTDTFVLSTHRLAFAYRYDNKQAQRAIDKSDLIGKGIAIAGVRLMQIYNVELRYREPADNVVFDLKVNDLLIARILRIAVNEVLNLSCVEMKDKPQVASEVW